MARKKKQNEDSQENTDNINESSDDTFGLPEIEYEPLKREEEQPSNVQPEPEPQVYSQESTPEPEATYSSSEEIRDEPQEASHEEIFQGEEERFISFEEEEPPSIWPKILGIAALLLIVAAGVWYFVKYRPEQLNKEELAKQEILAREAEEQKKKEAALAEQQRLDEQRRADSLANVKPAIGVIETLSERTGRYYVIVASGIDGDLIMDYAKKLSPKGVSTKIIPPNGKVKFYRLAVAEGDTYASTQTTADELKSEYEGGAWVIKF
jgi:hypothetical protein